MSAAAAQTAEAAVAAPPAKGKKKLLIIIAAAVLLLAVAGGGGAFFYMKKKAAEAAAAAAEAEGDDAAPAAHGKAEPAKHDAGHPPTFLPLEPFVVNLADRDADRYAQIGVTLEIEDPKFAEQLKAYMPAIRNGVLMVLAHKNSQELLERKGKEALAAEIMRETVRPLGIELEDAADAEPAEKGGAHKDNEPAAKPKKPKKSNKTPIADSPVRHVHFSNFIIQ